MNIKEYLDRINYTEEIQPTFEVLSKLQWAHLLSVPFENLDIQNNVKIDLTNSFDKIVIRRRGGFCYELNGLFYELLKEVGFEVKMVSARVYSEGKGYGAEFAHMAIIVKIQNDNYLVDVGFGEFASYPIKIDLNIESDDQRGIYKIENFDENYNVVKRRKSEGEYIPEYIFSTIERKLDDFDEMCYYQQTNKESHFRQKIICTLLTKDGRVTLTGNTLKFTKHKEVMERHLKNETEFDMELWKNFGIKL